MAATFLNFRRSAARTALAGTATATLVLVGAASAWAHVEVEAGGAAAGATDVTLTFHVPNEAAPAVTTVITFDLPLETPLVGVTAEEQNGFTPTFVTSHLSAPVAGPDGPVSDVVSEVTFAGGTIEREDDPAFRLHVDKLPDGVERLTFTALQTYDDGTVVSWTEIAAEGAAEPEHPAPVLELGAADPAAESTSSAAGPVPVDVSATAEPAAAGATAGVGARAEADGPSDQSAPVGASSASSGGVAGLAAGGLALLGAGIALYARRTNGPRLRVR